MRHGKAPEKITGKNENMERENAERSALSNNSERQQRA